ncbi:Polyketide cyclase / dehydrase and lipid transport [Cribrihabitans marinus]|uniref:Polyketide cyclase / dehydrase and lipid transport n=1 Tax=Cribrihabitans marinus TaxID=1227549 RepID=A0A1H6XD41_9RHOB|nr:SRPBCC family protein [Cribrihabitans marinus]GGH27193.1 hypothetical protein GCM10010973_15350 [Cribrihabitans marinus]SEJ27053.1 Polyketide cyclase / dehydrase and lipid transport [Cribrihabitans marinus]
MKFSAREDIEAPIGDVFDILSRFDQHERSAIRRGIEVQRRSGGATNSAGLEWESRFEARGRIREVHTRLARYEPPSLMRFESLSGGLEGVVNLELLALSPRRTRLGVDVDLRARTLTARLFLQSLKLGRKSLMQRLRLKLEQFAKDVEARNPGRV